MKINTGKVKAITSEAIAVLYISLWLYTAISKLTDYYMTREQMALMPLLTPVAQVMAWLLPATEIVIAALIFLPSTRRLGLKAATGLMVLFCVYIVYMMTYYEQLPCSCGGLLEALSWKDHLIFNSGFIALGVIALAFTAKRRQLPQQEVLAVAPQ